MRAKNLCELLGMVVGLSLLLTALAGCESSEPELPEVRVTVQPTVRADGWDSGAGSD